MPACCLRERIAFRRIQRVSLVEASKFPLDIPYMGLEFYYTHVDVQGDEENPYAHTRDLWRVDGMIYRGEPL